MLFWVPVLQGEALYQVLEQQLGVEGFAKARKKYQDTRICSRMENNLELNHNSIDKGRALERLGQHIGVRMEEILSCGDGGNDDEMIQHMH